MKKTISITVASVLAAALVLTFSAAAVDEKLEKSKTNDFQSAKIEIAVEENDDGNTKPTIENTLTWEQDTANSVSYTAEKKVNVTNTGSDSNSANAFVRVCIYPRWVTTITTEDTDGEAAVFETDVTNTDYLTEIGSFPNEIVGNSFTMGNIVFTLSDDWSENWIYSNGYFYYRSALAPNETTETLLESVLVKKDIYDSAEKRGVELVVDVLSDSIQTEGQDAELDETSAIAERWGTENVVVKDGGLAEAPFEMSADDQDDEKSE